MMTTTDTSRAPMADTSAPQVVVVSKQSQMNGLLETVLDAGQYDIVFVESTEHAYSHIKRLTPSLIIVCLDIDDIDGFQVISMLKLDSQTRGIPIVTCTVNRSDDDVQDEALELPSDVFFQEPVMCMN